MTTHPQKITFGEMRESGVRDLLIYCRDHQCSEINADRWPDHVSLSDIELKFTCTKCVKHGADVQAEVCAWPNWERGKGGHTRQRCRDRPAA